MWLRSVGLAVPLFTDVLPHQLPHTLSVLRVMCFIAHDGSVESVHDLLNGMADIQQVCLSAKDCAERAGRVEVTVHDVLGALDELGTSLETLFLYENHTEPLPFHRGVLLPDEYPPSLRSLVLLGPCVCVCSRPTSSRRAACHQIRPSSQERGEAGVHTFEGHSGRKRPHCDLLGRCCHTKRRCQLF